MGNTGPSGNLDNDKFARAIMEYRNTPLLDGGPSPAQLLLHRQIRDFLPSHPSLLKPHVQWIAAAKCQEKVAVAKTCRLAERYKLYAKNLAPLQVGQHVVLQNQYEQAALLNVWAPDSTALAWMDLGELPSTTGGSFV